jgi:hypothetical protein
MKKRIAIMITGQIRLNGLSDNESKCNKILDSIDKYLLNENFKNIYDYDIFISTDKIDIEKTKLYFGENLKNINLTENNWFYNPLETEIKNYEYFYDIYLNLIKNFESYYQYKECHYQNYRIYCAYNMVLEYEKKVNMNYDYYIKIRTDCICTQDFSQLIHLLEEKNKNICMEHDILIIVNNKYKDIFNFINFIGSYQTQIDNSDGIFNYFFPPWGYDLNTHEYLYFFCPERQIIEYIRYLSKNNKHITKDIFLGISYPSFQLIYRGNNQYGFSTHTDEQIFVPVYSIDYLINNC